MAKSVKTLRVCKNGHSYYKSSDCPVCPICESERNSGETPFSDLSAPAQRALENKKIKTVSDLSRFTEKEILDLHGIGPSAIPKLKAVLNLHGLKFSK